MTSVSLFFAGLLSVLAIIKLQKKAFFIQYLFFLRYPLLIASIMVILPLFAGEDDPKIIQNWFELDFVGLSIVTWLSILLGWVIMHTAGVLFVHVPSRNKLAFLRSEQDILKSHEGKDKRSRINSKSIPLWLRRYRLPLFALLAGPIIVTCWQRSGELSALWKFAAVGSGILGTAVVAAISWRIRTWYLKHQEETSREKEQADAEAPDGPQKKTPESSGFCFNLSPKEVLQNARRTVLTDEGLRSLTKGCEEEHDESFTRRRALSFLILGALMYIFGLSLVRPDQQTILTESVPALAYLLVLMMLLASILSALSFVFDKFRVPVLLIFLAVAFLNSKLADIDHYYNIERAACPNEDRSVASYSTIAAYRDWAGFHPQADYPTVVVVAASGGGIAAAQWTAQVLRNLDAELKGQFAKAIPMISAVSGGAVGSMYVINSYTEDGPPQSSSAWQRIVDQAGRSSLGAVGWGFVYPDFWRLFTSFLVSKDHDRAWAIEQRWAAGIIDEEVKMSRWRKDIREGRRPVLIFNATVTETGERLVVAPVDITTSGESAWKARKLLYPGDDIRVVTAARISATFPYVTPIARPNAPNDCKDNIYHAADGGYYDNFGVITAIDYLRDIAPIIKEEKRKVLLVQIRSSDPEKLEPANQTPSYLSGASGPIKTLLSVRAPSQVVRNNKFVESLRDEWSQNGVGELQTVTFQLDTENPLSWHLSPTDKKRIAKGWESHRNQCSLAKLKRAMGVSIDVPANICPT